MVKELKRSKRLKPYFGGSLPRVPTDRFGGGAWGEEEEPRMTRAAKPAVRYIAHWVETPAGVSALS